MTIEEKARAYDEALKLARDYHEDKNCLEYLKGVLENIFPELAESEDERIRKAQLDYWRSVGGKEWHGVPVQETIAWLEKQAPKTALDKAIEEEVDAWLKKQGNKPQVDGFDAELNALLKKYEHLPKKELMEPLEFYLAVLRDTLDIMKWTEEDEGMMNHCIGAIHIAGRCVTNSYTAKDKKAMKDWLKGLKQRMEQ